MTAFRHLFLFPNHNIARDFYRRIEEKARHLYAPVESHRASLRLTMSGYDGQHEISVGVVQDIESDRFRGRYFDKISIHETVELTFDIHRFVQIYVGRSSHGLYGGLEPPRILVDEQVPPDRMYFLNSGFVDEELRTSPMTDAFRYGLMGMPGPEWKPHYLSSWDLSV